MEVSELSPLIESINSLSYRFTFIAGLLTLCYFTICFFSFMLWFKGDGSDRPPELEGADLLIEQARYEQLFKKCHRLLKRRPNNVEAHWYIALCYYHKSRYDKAREYFLKTKKANPHWAEGVDVYLGYMDKLEEADVAVQH
ncbi:tetratricopeptide repeat protein [Shewanella halotolerans]|uniref:tetratricopeptide repeat protein n=1 Tax=Shewanella halotolerans TaxID=2864204 RepID=UPI001C65E9D6|nr:tetratricopeptide repeat protein [Shewanella halotolerans]QYJ88402.1 tetratricopeptide repeat protein [Shewanella halotolerans]